MSWTEDRVELLKKLWQDGLSASQIAGQLGGVTRNAVIGKVHRLGLSGRAKSPSNASPRPRKPRISNGMRPRPQYRGNAALQLDYGADPEYDLDPLANIVPMGPRVSILQLTDATCRWPIGDPGARRLRLLRQPEQGEPALLSLSRAHRLSAARGAAARAARHARRRIAQLAT